MGLFISWSVNEADAMLALTELFMFSIEVETDSALMKIAEKC